MHEDLQGVGILIADDDSDDRLLLKEVFSESKLPNTVDFVVDGMDLMDYLKRRSKYTVLSGKPLPRLILLDLNMPCKNGFEALEEIKADPQLRSIPVVVFTTSNADDDIQRSYRLGVSSFITKPSNFQTLVEVVETLNKYWFSIVKLPIY